MRRSGPGLKSFLFASLAACGLFIGASTTCGAQETALLEAQKLFKQYTDLERNYDTSITDLYAPDAVIKDTRQYQDGQSKTLTWTGESYKQILKAQIPVAKARGEQYAYSAPAYTREGSGVRIRCTRTLQHKKFSSPLELLTGPSKGSWKILEEVLQSQP